MVRKVWYPRGLEDKEEFELTEEDTPYQGRIYTLYKGEETSEAEFPVDGWTRREKEESLEEITARLYSLLGTTISKTAIYDADSEKFKEIVIISEPPKNDFRSWYKARVAILSKTISAETTSERFPLLKIEEEYNSEGGRSLIIKTDDEKLNLRIGRRRPYIKLNEYEIYKMGKRWEEQGEYDLNNPSHVEFFRYLAEASKYLPIFAPFDESPEVYSKDAQLPVEEVNQEELCNAILKLLQSKNNNKK